MRHNCDGDPIEIVRMLLRWHIDDVKELTDWKFKHDEAGIKEWERQVNQKNAREKIAEDEAARLDSDQITPEEEAALAEMDANLYDSKRLEELPKPEWLIDGVAQARVLTRIVGEPKSLKSFMALDMAGCIGRGGTWQGIAVHRSKVLYIVAEGATGTMQRVRAWEEKHNSGLPMRGVHWYPRPVQAGNAHDLRLLKLFIKRHGFELVIFDTQARCTVGMDENSATEFGKVMHMLGRLIEATQCTAWLVHHTPIGDDSRGRGSNSVAGAIDSEMVLKRHRAEGTVTLKNTLQKDAEEFADIEFKVHTIKNPDEEVPDSVALTRIQDYAQPAFQIPKDIPDLDGRYDIAVMKTLVGHVTLGASQAEVIKWTIDSGIKTENDKVPDPKTIRRTMDRLVKVEILEMTGTKFRLSEMGHTALIDLGEITLVEAAEQCPGA